MRWTAHRGGASKASAKTAAAVKLGRKDQRSQTLHCLWGLGFLWHGEMHARSWNSSRTSLTDWLAVSRWMGEECRQADMFHTAQTQTSRWLSHGGWVRAESGEKHRANRVKRAERRANSKANAVARWLGHCYNHQKSSGTSKVALDREHTKVESRRA